MGQLLGSLVTATVSRRAIKRGDGPIYGLLFLSSMLMYCAAFLSAKIQRPGGGPRQVGSKWFKECKGLFSITHSASPAISPYHLIPRAEGCRRIGGRHKAWGKCEC